MKKSEEKTSETNLKELARELLHLPFEQVVPSDTNPRLNLDREPFEELKKSIFANGLLQPIVVRPKGETYEIIGGHRRYSAVKELAAAHPSDRRFTRIAVVVVHVGDELVPVLQLAENLNRSDLSAIEVADGVARAVKSGVDPQKLADNLGWTRRGLNRYLQLAEAPPWLRDYAKEVKVAKKKVDAHGNVVIDPRTNKPAMEVERHPGLGFSELHELLMLFNLLHEADKLQLEEVGGELFRPQAERTTKRIAVTCAAEGWSRSKLREEIKRAKDPRPKNGTSERTAQPPIVVTEDRCVLDLRRAGALSVVERNELAARLTHALTRFRFKSVVITP